MEADERKVGNERAARCLPCHTHVNGTHRLVGLHSRLTCECVSVSLCLCARFEEQNKREDPHTGNIFRLKAPSKEVLDDIGLQLMHYHAEAFPRGKPLFPPNPDVTTGRADGVIEGEDLTDIVDPSAEPYFWRVYCLTADPDRDGKTSRLFQDQGDSVLIKDKDVLRCTCVVWRDLAASGVPQHKRTCR